MKINAVGTLPSKWVRPIRETSLTQSDQNVLALTLKPGFSNASTKVYTQCSHKVSGSHANRCGIIRMGTSQKQKLSHVNELNHSVWALWPMIMPQAEALIRVQPQKLLHKIMPHCYTHTHTAGEMHSKSLLVQQCICIIILYTIMLYIVNHIICINKYCYYYYVLLCIIVVIII